MAVAFDTTENIIYFKRIQQTIQVRNRISSRTYSCQWKCCVNRSKHYKMRAWYRERKNSYTPNDDDRAVNRQNMRETEESQNSRMALGGGDIASVKIYKIEYTFAWRAQIMECTSHSFMVPNYMKLCWKVALVPLRKTDSTSRFSFKLHNYFKFYLHSSRLQCTFHRFHFRIGNLPGVACRTILMTRIPFDAMLWPVATCNPS